MRAIGFRAEKDAVHWAIVEGSVQAPVLVQYGCLCPPKRCSGLDALCWFRRETIDLLAQHLPNRIAVRLMDAFPETQRTPTSVVAIMSRLRVEGIVLEAGHSFVQATSSIPQHILLECRTRDRPAKNRFTVPGGQSLDWTNLKSFSLRQAIVIAASVLKLDDSP